MKLKVGVFFGGESVEHEISIISANQAMHAIDKTKYVVNMYFNPNAKEEAKSKMTRLIKNEIRYSFQNECMAS